MEQLALQEILPEVERLGANIVTVTPQKREIVAEHVAEAGLTFPVLIDAAFEAATSYGLEFTLPEDLRELYVRWGIGLDETNADGSWRLPIPASFVIDTSGIVRFASVDPDYRFRPEPAEAYLPVLEELAG